MSRKKKIHMPREGIPVVRIQMVREGVFPYSAKPVRNAADAARIIRSFLSGADREYFVALLLDSMRQVNALNVVAAGSLNHALVHPREVFKPAVLGNADCVILGHNHPSGNPQPSTPDLTLTKRLLEAGELLGIRVLDHIIVGDTRHVSLLEQGLIPHTGEEK